MALLSPTRPAPPRPVPGGAAQPACRHFSGAIACLRWTYRRHGVAGWYRGAGVMAARDVPTFGVYMLVYRLLVDRLGTRLSPANVTLHLVAGGSAGVVAWTLAMPTDVIKSLLQADVQRTRYSGAVDCARKLYAAGGAGAFGTGLGVTCLRAFPANAITFLVYAKTLHYLNGSDGSQAL